MIPVVLFYPVKLLPRRTSNMKKMILLSGLFLIVGVIAFAGGMPERVTVTGEVTLVTPSTEEGVIVTLSTDEGEYTVRLTEDDITSLDIQAGQTVTITGLEIEDEDGDIPEVEARSVTIDGVVYDLDDDDEDDDDEDDAEDDDDDDDMEEDDD
jgi:3-dehydroquinate synthase class II